MSPCLYRAFEKLYSSYFCFSSLFRHKQPTAALLFMAERIYTAVTGNSGFGRLEPITTTNLTARPGQEFKAGLRPV
jgi:hypothetical protein